MSQLETTKKTSQQTLKDHLSKYGFNQYNKIADAVEKEEITIKDLLKCSNVDLTEICKEYHISTIQKNRFIEAIENLSKNSI